jgi:competence protein ComEA
MKKFKLLFAISLMFSLFSSYVFADEVKTININTATVEELATLPGVGEAIAKNIVEHREKNGNFKTIEELKNVKGIGEKKFEKIKDLITVGERAETASEPNE